MRAMLVHAVLAGGVNDPRRLAQWTTDPTTLHGLGVEPGSLDLEALRGFAGLALKVRHNGLRDAFVNTFRLLNVAGLEIEVFADYALAHAEKGLALASTTEARAHELIEFLRGWHDPALATHALLWDLVRHEQSLLQLVQPSGVEAAADALPRPTPGSVPRLRGTARLHEMRHDPRAIVRVLRQRDPQLTSVAATPCMLCYWRPAGESSVTIVELDAFGFAVLQAADGDRTVADLSAALGLGARPPPRMLQLLMQLQEAGLLVFTRAVPPQA